MKKNIKNFIKIACFLVLLAGVLYASERVLMPKGSTINEFYYEDKNTIDVLYVGSSSMMAAVSPTMSWDEYGFTSYNMYSWSQPVWTSYHYVKEALKYQKPKVVVVEGFGLTYGKSYMDTANFDKVSNQFSLLMRPSLNRLQLALAMRKSQETKVGFIDNYISLVSYHSRWKTLEESDFRKVLENQYSTVKGFGPIFTTEAIEPHPYPDNISPQPMYKYSQEYLEKLIALSKKEGFKLIITVMPYQLIDGEFEIYQSAKQICSENNVEFINYNEPDIYKSIGFDFSKNMAEHAHVNLSGAKLITHHLGGIISKEYLSQKNYSPKTIEKWNTASEVQNRDFANMSLRLSLDITDFANKLKENKDYITVLATQGNLNQLGVEKAQTAFENLGLPTDFLTKNNQNGLFILDGDNHIFAKTSAGQTIEAEYKWEDLTVKASSSLEKCEIFIGKDNAAKNRNGINVVVYDKQSKKMIHSISFNAFDSYNGMTE